MSAEKSVNRRRGLSGPVKIGLAAGVLGLLLTLVGVARGAVSSNPASIAGAVVIGFGVWYLVAWAVASAARDVEHDIESTSDGQSAEHP